MHPRSKALPGPSEKKTRQELIDPELKKAGWDVTDPEQVGLEIPVDGFDPAAWQQLQQQIGVCAKPNQHSRSSCRPASATMCSIVPIGEIIAVVEAKRTSVDPRLAEAQAEFYVTETGQAPEFPPLCLSRQRPRPLLLGRRLAPKRLVQGFFSPADLENLLYLRTHQTPLSLTPINPSITNRGYQVEAIRRVGEAFAQGRRKALLVMATGTGKTRARCRWWTSFCAATRRGVSFLWPTAIALVGQALSEGFHEHIPSEPCTRICAAIAIDTPVASTW